MEIKSTKPVTITDVKDILARRKEGGELGYEQAQALEHAERFAADSKKSEKMVAALVKTGKITEDAAVKIVDIKPASASTLKAVLLKDRIELSDDEIAGVLKEIA